jgi:ISXO2-like transposase domain/Transposase zinc-ribbon domain
MAKFKRIHQMTIGQWEATFPDEDACAAYLVAHRWPDGVHCPRCGAVEPHDLGGFRWQCYQCAPTTSYRFSHIAGTVFENTNKPLREWFRVIHLMLTAKKGVSALQVMRFMGFGSYKTAWYMCHRIRAALVDRDFQQLMGIVEADETFIGGKAKNKHKGKGRGGPGRGGTGSGKIPIAGAVSRKGNVVARVVENVKGETLTGFIRESVSHKVSLLITDEWIGYHKVRQEYPSAVIQHTKGQYVVGSIHTNTIEGFWSMIKRSIVGSFHKVSSKYLPLYVAEAQFKYNNRENADIFGMAIKGC